MMDCEKVDNMREELDKKGKELHDEEVRLLKGFLKTEFLYILILFAFIGLVFSFGVGYTLGGKYSGDLELACESTCLSNNLNFMYVWDAKEQKCYCENTFQREYGTELNTWFEWEVKDRND